MSKEFITSRDIVESAKKHGDDNVLVWDPAVFRPMSEKEKKFDCNWVPIQFKNANGNIVKRVHIKVKKIVTASGAKPGQLKDGKMKNLIIAFREMEEKDLAFGEFVAKSAETPELQKVEDIKVKELIKEHLDATNEFNKAMIIINKSFQKICQELKDAKSLGFSVRKDKTKKKNSDITVYSICQTTREDKDSKDPDAEPIPLEFPITRLKLMLGSNGQVGVDSWDKSINGWKFRANVYDARKMKKGQPPVLARVKVDGKTCPLDEKNVGTFITWKSVLGGVLEFNDIVISKFGFSLENKFQDVFVKRNKSNIIEPVFNKEELDDMCNSDSESENEVEMITDSVDNVKINKKTGKAFQKAVKIDKIDDIEDEDSDLEAGAEGSSGDKASEAGSDEDSD